jgi:DNA invertase Pin-like site-specific DNA recombinase
MKTAEPSRLASSSAASPTNPAKVRLSSSKIRDAHLFKLAIVYVRQSTPQQVLENRESTERQYALVDFAKVLGWPTDRIIVIDEDQGQSGARADNRSGYQRLLTEVTLDHVGIVLGLEMSRLARSSKDWHHLLELCGIFGVVLADQDGVYDPGDANDRLLLGLKGTMSEVELHTMRNRLERGRMNKAQRGELFCGVPMGYVMLPNGEVAFDPDTQAHAVMQIVFDKFAEIGTIYALMRDLLRNNISLPVRPRTGPKKGELAWRRPSMASLCQILHHPIYAGAYAYGRRPNDPQAKYSGQKNRGKKWKSMEEWKVLIKDRLPAYITWDRYLQNQERLRQNRRGLTTPGTPGNGTSLLSSLLVCGTCGRRMTATYRTQLESHYICARHLTDACARTCYGLKSTEIDQLVAQQALRSLEPAALELSMKALEDVTKERARLDKNWQQSLQRARYDIDLAERRYRAVDPEHRLVAATLERSWNEALQAERQLQEDYDRFLRESPPQLTDQERATIEALAKDIPALWDAPATTNVERKQILRCLIDRVVVQVRCDSEHVAATIHWKGGYESHHEFIRPVKTYAQLRDFEPLMARIVELRESGHDAEEIANALNQEGFRPPKHPGAFNKPMIYQLLKRRGLIGNERSHDELLGDGEWWLTDLARELQMSCDKLRDWSGRGWVHYRKTPLQGYRVLWADAQEVRRLKKLLAQSRRGMQGYTEDLTTPKARPQKSKRR